MGKKHIFFTLLLVLALLMGNFAFGQDNKTKDEDEQVEAQEKVTKLVEHHLSDAYYYELFEDETAGKTYGFPLPVILIDHGLKIFSSSKFQNENGIAQVDGQHYKIFKGKIYKTNAAGDLNMGEYGYPTNEKPWDFSITKNVFFIFVASVILLLVFIPMANAYKKNKIPKGFYRFLEPMVIYIRDEVAKPTIGKKYKKYMSFLLTIFFFILFMNLAGLIPGSSNITGNITVTFALSMVTFVITQVVANKDYWKHIFWFPDVPVIMKIVLAPIELLGIFTKPFALLMRLFANMTAGHTVILTFLGLIMVFKSWGAGPAFMGFSLFIGLIEILVAFLQAYIFTLLSGLYIGMAVADHGEEAEKEKEEMAPGGLVTEIEE